MTAALMSMAGPAVAATDLWWDTGYLRRYNIDVRVGASSPDKGYAGYTARIASLDTQALIGNGELLPDCSDLRLLYYDGLSWQELPRHVLGCNSASTDIRFMLAADIPANGNDDNYYLYYSNAAPALVLPVTTTNVYLWFDDASVDRSASYVRGRIDPWHGTGWDNSLSWNAAGYYTYNNGDNFTSGYRRDVDERDVYAEAEFFHTGCYQFNQTTGMMVRGIIAGGAGGSETSDHYYASNRGDYPGCRATGYTHDGDVMKTNRGTIAADGANPPDIAANVWRRQGLAAWLTTPTNLAFWDEDLSANWAAPGYPSNANLQASGSDAIDYTGRGFIAVMTAQDIARVRNILVRRYIDPEPVLVLDAEVPMPDLVLQKSLQTVYDPINNNVSPKAIPGSWVEYTITAQNTGVGSVDPEGLTVTDPLPANVVLFVGDLDGPGSGPVEFTDGAGAAASGLSLDFGGLDDFFDDIEFSLNGIDWDYEPSPDVDGFDAAVRFVRVRPSGTFAGTNGPPAKEFSLRLRVKVQ